jgi:hypothetical protein
MMNSKEIRYLRELADNEINPVFANALNFYADYANQIERLEDLVQKDGGFFGALAGDFKVKVAVDYLEKRVSMWRQRYGR